MAVDVAVRPHAHAGAEVGLDVAVAHGHPHADRHVGELLDRRVLVHVAQVLVHHPRILQLDGAALASDDPRDVWRPAVPVHVHLPRATAAVCEDGAAQLHLLRVGCDLDGRAARTAEEAVADVQAGALAHADAHAKHALPQAPLDHLVARARLVEQVDALEVGRAGRGAHLAVLDPQPCLGLELGERGAGTEADGAREGQPRQAHVGPLDGQHGAELDHVLFSGGDAEHNVFAAEAVVAGDLQRLSDGEIRPALDACPVKLGHEVAAGQELDHAAGHHRLHRLHDTAEPLGQRVCQGICPCRWRRCHRCTAVAGLLCRPRLASLGAARLFIRRSRPHSRRVRWWRLVEREPRDQSPLVLSIGLLVDPFQVDAVVREPRSAAIGPNIDHLSVGVREVPTQSTLWRAR
mmetsp:Transcript_23174/g.72718  ORF Transcript_23174/g.72718 Transcript_23174/m.72718 type:complete len:406 (-) Transcript_23174:673-1890(-)